MKAQQYQASHAPAETASSAIAEVRILGATTASQTVISHIVDGLTNGFYAPGQRLIEMTQIAGVRLARDCFAGGRQSRHRRAWCQRLFRGERWGVARVSCPPRR